MSEYRVFYIIMRNVLLYVYAYNMYLYSDSSSKPSAHYAFGEAPESPETLPDKPFQHDRCGKIRHFTALPPAKTKKKPTLCHPDRLRSAPIRENKEKS